MRGYTSARAGFVFLGLILGVPAAYGQQVSYTVTFDDPTQTATDLYAPLTSNIMAAGARWGGYFRPPTNVTLDVVVSFSTTIPAACGFTPAIVVS